jgi:hypothetical protein
LGVGCQHAAGNKDQGQKTEVFYKVHGFSLQLTGKFLFDLLQYIRAARLYLDLLYLALHDGYQFAGVNKDV